MNNGIVPAASRLFQLMYRVRGLAKIVERSPVQLDLDENLTEPICNLRLYKPTRYWIELLQGLSRVLCWVTRYLHTRANSS
jgi:hypothetical protein